MDLQLRGKRALITGSTAGIGFAAAAGLVREGASIIVNGRSVERVNTLPPLKWGSFWANPSIDELGAQGAIPPPLEHVDCGVVVPIQGHAAIALDPTIPERKMLEDFPATRASLGRVGRIYLDDLATSTFSLVPR